MGTEANSSKISLEEKMLRLYWQNLKKITKSKKNKQRSEAYKKSWEQFNIVGGHYILLRKDTRGIEVFADSNVDHPGVTRSDIKFDDIPMDFGFKLQLGDDSNDIRKNIIDSLVSFNQSTKIDSAETPLNFPKYYLNLPPMRNRFSIHQGSYSETLVKDSNYVFCLSDEVVFFSYAWRFWYLCLGRLGGDFKISELKKTLALPTTLNEKEIRTNYSNGVQNIYDAKIQDAFMGIKNEGKKLIDDIDNILYGSGIIYDEFVKDVNKNLGLSRGQNLKQLIKYSSHVNKYLGKPFLEYNDDLIARRNVIQGAKFDSNIHQNLIEILFELIYSTQKKVKAKYAFPKANEELTINDCLSIIHLISRTFPIPNFYYIALHSNKMIPDHFIFPLVENATEKISFKRPGYISVAGNKGDIEVTTPLLISAYLKPLYDITKGKEIEERPKTIGGFGITQLMCQACAARVIDSIYYGSIVKGGMIKEAIKSAKAAIMARNLSHNIGSHVISYLHTNLSDEQKILEKNVLDNLITENGGNYTVRVSPLGEERQIHETAKIKLPYLTGIAKFLLYLQERQDFVASISTDLIPSTSNINFKDFVLDMFAWDSRNRRHQDADKNARKGQRSTTNVNEVVHKGQKEDEVEESKEHKNVLLEYIAKSEGLERDDIDIFFNGFDIDRQIDSTIDSPVEPRENRNIEISIPGGIMGRQAIFSMLENIIRNAAKHGKREKTGIQLDLWLGNPEITRGGNIKIYEAEFEFLHEGRKDHLSKLKELTDSYYSFIIHDNYNNGNKDTLETIQSRIDEALIDENGDKNEEAKGLKEIKISSAWLRGLRIEENENLASTYPVVLVGKRMLAGEEHLAYHFLLPKGFDVIYVYKEGEHTKGQDFLELKKEFSRKKWFLLSELEIKRLNHLSSVIIIAENEMGEDNEFLHNYSKRIVFTKELRSSYFEEFNLKDLLVDIEKDILYKKFLDAYEFIIKRNLLIDNLSKVKIIVNDEKSEASNLDNSNPEIFNATPSLLNLYGKAKEEFLDCMSEEKTLAIYFRSHFNIDHNEQVISAQRSLVNGSKFVFIESVTGDNSSDRLLRHEPTDRFWKLKLSEAALTKVLLIDERLWDEYAGKQGIATTDFKDIPKSLKILNLKNIEIANVSYASEIPEIFIPPVYDIENKHIHEHSIRLDLLNPEFDDKLLGYNFILIHQGLVDKLYEHYKDKFKLKNLSYEDVYNMLGMIIGNKAQLIVHSGRSRPSKEQLPDKYPFLNFSIIRNLLHDTKYSLVSQLYSSSKEL